MEVDNWNAAVILHTENRQFKITAQNSDTHLKNIRSRILKPEIEHTEWLVWSRNTINHPH